MNIIPSTAPKILTSNTTFYSYLFIVDTYSKIPKIYGVEKIKTEEVIDMLDMFHSRFGKIETFLWWDFERISADAGKKFTSMDFKEEFQTRGFYLTSAVPDHPEMNIQVKVT